MKIKKMIYYICLIFTVLIFALNTYVQAASISSIVQDAKDFTSSEIEENGLVNVTSDKLKTTINIINIAFLTVALITAFISIALMGINFMVQSIEEKAKIKEALIPFCIGAIVSFGAFGIWRIVISIFTTFDSL